jgi:hypothetical protein
LALGVPGQDLRDLDGHRRRADRKAEEARRAPTAAENRFVRKNDGLFAQVRDFDVKLYLRSGWQAGAQNTGQLPILRGTIVVHAIIKKNDPVQLGVGDIHPPPHQAGTHDPDIVAAGGAKRDGPVGQCRRRFEAVQLEHGFDDAVVNIGTTCTRIRVRCERRQSISEPGVGDIALLGRQNQLINGFALCVQQTQNPSPTGERETRVIKCSLGLGEHHQNPALSAEKCSRGEREGIGRHGLRAGVRDPLKFPVSQGVGPTPTVVKLDPIGRSSIILIHGELVVDGQHFIEDGMLDDVPPRFWGRRWGQLGTPTAKRSPEHIPGADQVGKAVAIQVAAGEITARRHVHC